MAGNQTLTITGSVALMIGVIVLGPVAAKPAATRCPTLAAPRRPRRRCWSALAVAAPVTVIGASLKVSAAHGIDRSLTADLIVAATAELAGLTVLHIDKDFEVIAEVTGQPVERLVTP